MIAFLYTQVLRVHGRLSEPGKPGDEALEPDDFAVQQHRRALARTGLGPRPPPRPLPELPGQLLLPFG